MAIESILIVGQGIAGSTLGLECYHSNLNVKVVDDGHRSSSSVVAAGMWNPVVFRRLNKTYLCDDLLPAMQKFYRNAEQELGERFYFPHSIARFFSSQAEFNMWQEKADQPGFQPYLSLKTAPGIDRIPVNKNHGYGQVRDAGHIDAAVMLGASRNFLQNHHILIEDYLDVTRISPQYNVVETPYGQFDCVVFAEGFQGEQNPFFNYLPFGPAKGEVLTVAIDNLDTDAVLNAGFYVLPIGGNKFKVGATYQWDFEDSRPTEGGRSQLVEKLRGLLPHPFRVLEHRAGIRPAVEDRRPLIGMHPVHHRLGLFNGLGSKGVMLAPYFARQLVEHLCYDQPINGEASLRRFDDKHPENQQKGKTLDG